MIQSIVIFCTILILDAQPVPEYRYNFTDYCISLRYPSEIHIVQTKDGYLLTFFRIQAKYTSIIQGLEPILLMHGLIGSSDSFISNDENKALAFVLANRGYDVWLGNNRGNKYGKRHVKYSNQDKAFWDFSFNEMAIYDLPAAFTYVFEKTKKIITYIGHSQGSTQMLAHLAMFPCQNVSIVRTLLKKYVGLGPIAFLSHSESVLFQFIQQPATQNVDLLITSKFLLSLGNGEFTPSDTWQFDDQGKIICLDSPLTCINLVGAVYGANEDLDNQKSQEIIAGNNPGRLYFTLIAGTSIRNMLHYEQIMKNGKFQKYDYGSVKNKRIYGRTSPPFYHLDRIDIPVYYFAGLQDMLSLRRDVILLAKSLVNCPKVWLNFYNAGHCSFLWGKTMPFYGDLFKILKDRY